MGKIDIGRFGGFVPQSGQTPTASATNFGDTSGGLDQATQRFGQTLQAVAEPIIKDRKHQDELIARSKAGDGLLNYEIASKTLVESIRDRVEKGELPLEKARLELETGLQQIKAPQFGEDHLHLAEQYGLGAKRLSFQASSAVDQVVDTAQRGELKSKFASGLDQLGKLALMPGSSVDKVMQQADAVSAFGRSAGLSEAEVGKTVQTFKDNTRFKLAQNDLIGARRDPAGLDAFQKRLEEGDLSATLDPDKKVALIREVDTYRFQAQNAAQRSLDKREKLAERAITATTRQIETGLPLTAEGWVTLRSTVEGTPYAGDFNRIVEQERSTQQVLRMPMAEQQQYVLEREAQLAQGGTLVERANLDRIKNTIDKNKKQLEAEPLTAAARLYGRAMPALDPGDLLQPGGTGRAATIFADRAVTLSAMRQQFGSQVGAKPLLPAEAQLITKALDGASPANATQLFGALRGAIEDDDMYRAAMQQLAPDAPVKARAGMLAAMDRTVTTQTNLMSADVQVSSARVAETMLAGEQILNKTKGEKAGDGKTHSLFVPDRGEFSASFADAVGSLYRSRPGAQEGDLQAALAYYVGKAAETGRTSRTPKDVDTSLVKEAITTTLGAIVDMNGHGQVKAPLGMTGSEMQTKMRARFSEMVSEQGLPPSAVAAFDFYGAVNYRRDGQYLLTLGGVPVLDKAGAPMVVDLDPMPYTGTRYRRAADQIPGQRTRAAGGSQ